MWDKGADIPPEADIVGWNRGNALIRCAAEENRFRQQGCRRRTVGNARSTQEKSDTRMLRCQPDTSMVQCAAARNRRTRPCMPETTSSISHQKHQHHVALQLLMGRNILYGAIFVDLNPSVYIFFQLYMIQAATRQADGEPSLPRHALSEAVRCQQIKRADEIPTSYFQSFWVVR